MDKTVSLNADTLFRVIYGHPLITQIRHLKDLEVDVLMLSKFLYRYTDGFNGSLVEAFELSFEQFKNSTIEKGRRWNWEYDNAFGVIMGALRKQGAPFFIYPNGLEDYSPKRLKLWQSDIYYIKTELKYNIYPMLENDRLTGCGLVKELYEEFGDFEFDAKVLKYDRLFNEASEVILELVDLWEQEAKPYLKVYERLQNGVKHENVGGQKGASVSTQDKEAQGTTQTLPKELQTEKAKEVLQKAIDGGLLNEDYTTTEKVSSNRLKALLADILADKIGIKDKYKIFAPIWGVSAEQLTRGRSGTKEAGRAGGQEFIFEVFPDGE